LRPAALCRTVAARTVALLISVGAARSDRAQRDQQSRSMKSAHGTSSGALSARVPDSTATTIHS
jgi:hypothetical protein